MRRGTLRAGSGPRGSCLGCLLRGQQGVCPALRSPGTSLAGMQSQGANLEVTGQSPGCEAPKGSSWQVSLPSLLSAPPPGLEQPITLPAPLASFHWPGFPEEGAEGSCNEFSHCLGFLILSAQGVLCHSPKTLHPGLTLN